MSVPPTATAERAEAVLRTLGIEGGHVDVVGHEGEIAAILVPSTAWHRLLGSERSEVSRELKALGFRYVALDLSVAS